VRSRYYVIQTNTTTFAMLLTRIVNANNWLIYRTAVKIASILPMKWRRLGECRIIFVAGFEGSGTGIVKRLLCVPDDILDTDHQIYTARERPNVTRLEFLQRISIGWQVADILHRLWETDNGANEVEQRHLRTMLANIRVPKNITSVVIKRSYPSGRAGTIVPRLSDFIEIASKVKIVNVNRALSERKSSIVRRQFVSNLTGAEKRTAKVKMILEKQLASVRKDDLYSFEYRDLLDRPESICREMEKFLDFECGSLSEYKDLVVPPRRS